MENRETFIYITNEEPVKYDGYCLVDLGSNDETVYWLRDYNGTLRQITKEEYERLCDD